MAPSCAWILTPICYLDENFQIPKLGPPLQPFGIGRLREWLYSLPLTLEDIDTVNFVLCVNFFREGQKTWLSEAFQDVGFVPETPLLIFCGSGMTCFWILTSHGLIFGTTSRKDDDLGNRQEGNRYFYRLARHKLLKGEFYVRGAGMPVRDGGRVIERSDLIIGTFWLVEFECRERVTTSMTLADINTIVTMWTKNRTSLYTIHYNRTPSVVYHTDGGWVFIL